MVVSFENDYSSRARERTIDRKDVYSIQVPHDIELIGGVLRVFLSKLADNFAVLTVVLLYFISVSFLCPTREFSWSWFSV